MPGGLIQLISSGIQDAPLTGDPEITFFKATYKQYTNFSIWQNDRFLGELPFNKKGSKVIEKDGDLLQNLYFNLKIPYFQIIKNINKSDVINSGYDINSLDVTYNNINCLVFHGFDTWYIIPEILFSLNQNFPFLINFIESSKLEPNLLPEYITTSNLNQYVSLYKLKDNTITPLVSILRINSSYWEQFWLDFISSSTNPIMFDSLLTLLYDYSKLFLKMKESIYNNFYITTFLSNYTKYLNFSYVIKDLSNNNIYDTFGNPIIETETERYNEYIVSNTTTSENNVTQLLTNFDIDTVYKYCINNFLNFSDYINNTIQYNSLVLSLILNIIFSSTNTTFTFWKQWVVDSNNKINNKISITSTNNLNEWNNILSNILSTYFNTSNLKNQILDIFTKLYYSTETQINNLYTDLSFNNTTNMYIKLKTIFDRFYAPSTMQINFNNYFLSTYYNNINSYNNDNYDYLLNKQASMYPNLYNNINDISSNHTVNLTPIDLKYVYGIIATELIDFEYTVNKLTRGLQSFLVLWRNNIINRLYQRYLDNYTPNFYSSLESQNNNTNLTQKNLLFYNTITPSNDMNIDDFNNSFYEMFYKNSFFASVNLDNNNFLKFKENLNIITINDLSSNNTSNKQFNKLTINNIYTYNTIFYPINNYNYKILNQVSYDNINKILYIKYDNYYDMNCSIILYIDNNKVSYSSVNYVIRLNEKNFNSIYLAFNNVTYYINDTINNVVKLDVTYNSYLPIVTFSNDNNKYSNININKYYLLNKFDNNEPKINNILMNNNINIDTQLYDSSNIKVLTINSFNSNGINSPDIILSTTFIDNSYNYVTPGKHLYAVSYYTSTSESNISASITVNVLPYMMVDISNIPISNDNRVIGRRIYRTPASGSANMNIFYLLKDINDNTTTNYIDMINDTNLGLEYSVNGVNKLNNLPQNNDTTIKIPIKIIKSNNSNFYKITTYNDVEYILPTDYDNIIDIYIEELETNITVYDNTNFTFNNISNTIDFLNNIVYSPDYLYYLINNKNFKDNCPLVHTKVTIPINPPKCTLKSGTSTLSIGSYTYMITFYNSVTNVESYMSDYITINITNTNTVVYIDNFPTIFDRQYDSINIYRTLTNIHPGETSFYFITTIFTDSFTDNGSNILNLVQFNQYYMTKQINNDSVHKPIETPLVSVYNIGNVPPNIYGYFYTYVTFDNIESLESPISYIQIESNSDILLRLTKSNDIRVKNINIYRTSFLLNGIYHFLKTVPNNTTAYDNIADNSSNKPYNNVNSYNIPNYSLLKVPYNIVPNLNSFLSQSTDFNFINKKNISDLNDGMICKPFILMTNNSSSDIFDSSFDMVKSFNCGYIYFYNINFKINETSTITLNDISANYILPISSQQFYIKDPTDDYYYFDNNMVKQAPPNMIIQKTFNPSFDCFNISPQFFLTNMYYMDIMIDKMISSMNDFLSVNPDYMTAINITNKTNDMFMSIFTSIFNDFSLYGLTTTKVYDNIDIINNYPIMNFNYNPEYKKFNYMNTDFVNMAHSIVNFNNVNMNNIRVLSSVYSYYNANNKLSSNLIFYLNDVSRLFIEHIKYVNNNIDYLNITNPNNYDEEYYSYQEIEQDVSNNFYNYSGTNTIIFLQPIIDYPYSFSDIIITDENVVTTINNLSAENFDSTGCIIKNGYNVNKTENDYVNTTVLQIDRSTYNNEKFNYLGLIAVDCSFVFNDTYLITSDSNPQQYKYYKFDDNTIHKLTYNSHIARYNVDTINMTVSNPYLLSFITNNSYVTVIPLNQLMYIYFIEIDMSGNDIIPSHTNFIINNIIIEGYYDNSMNQLSFITNTLISFDCLSLFYQNSFNDNTTWTSSSKINNSNIVKFKQVNYSVNQTLLHLNIIPGSIYSINNSYYDCNDIIQYNDSCYFNIDNNVSTIQIISDVSYNLTPPMQITNDIVYSYQPAQILEITPSDQYILLVDLSKSRHFMIPVGDISNNIIPKSNYMSWLFPKNKLHLIPFNVSINIDISGNISGLSNTILPTYSYYMIQNGLYSCIYYYTHGDTIKVLDYTYGYYSIKDTHLTTIYLIDNNMFNTDVKQLLALLTPSKIGIENFVPKNLFFPKSTINISNYDNLVYYSQYINKDFNVKNIYNGYLIGSNIMLLGSNEIMVSMILSANNMNLYMPVIIKKYEGYTLPTITYTSLTTYQSYINSFIPMDISAYSLDSSNNLIVSIVLGNVNTSDTIISLSPEILIGSNNSIILNPGFHINNDFNLNLWKLKGIKPNGDVYYFYFWTLFTTTDLVNSYLHYNLSDMTCTAQPYYLDQNNKLLVNNYFKNYKYQSSYPNIICDDISNNMILNNMQANLSIYYKYYTDTRNFIDETNNNTYNIKTLDFNGVINVKPTICYLNSDASINNIIYYIIENANGNIDIITKLSEDIELDFSNNSIYYSLSYPQYIDNNIILSYVGNNMYIISQYEYLFLETNEIIMLDNNYFYVMGLNMKTNYYELELLGTNNNKLRYNYSGYHTLGNYLRKDNMIIPEMDYMNTLTYITNETTNLNQGDVYLDNNKLVIYYNSISITKNNIFKFDQKPLTIQLFYSNGNLYLFDNFVKLKIMDKIIRKDNDTIYNIINIRDNIIFVDISLNGYTNNSIVTFILPYQPFKIKYNISNLSNNMTIVLNDISNNIMDLYVNDISNNISNNIIRILDTNYISNFENSLYIPNYDLTNLLYLNNMHPIEIITEYDSSNNYFKIVYSNKLLNDFNFFYLQPVKVAGTFNYIKNIIKYGTYYHIYLLNPMTIKNTNINMILSPSYITIKEYYGNYKFKYNFGIESNNYNIMINTSINVVRYILYKDTLINIMNTFNGKPITFKYGVKQYNNENAINNINNNYIIPGNYISIYFYNNMMLNNDGYLSNFDTLSDSYHIITEYSEKYSYTVVHLAKILYQNKIKLYTSVISYNNKFYIDKLIPINLNRNNSFTYIAPIITQTQKLLEINTNKVQLIKKYNISFVGYPDISNNKYIQQFKITDNNNNLWIDFYKYVYLEQPTEYSTKYIVTIDVNNNYYIHSNTYLSNNITTIYTSYNNYILSSSMSNSTIKSLKLNDINLIQQKSNVPTIEYLSQNIMLSRMNNNDYSYKMIDNSTNLYPSYNLDPTQISLYKFNLNNMEKIEYISTLENIFTLTYSINNISTPSNYINTEMFIINNVNTSDTLDSNILLENTKQLRIKLLNNSINTKYNLYNYIKPWSTWSLLSGLNGAPTLKAVVSQAYITWTNNMTQIITTSDPNISYLTNNEITQLSSFMNAINTSYIARNNYMMLKNTIEPLILGNMSCWLNNPQFYLHVNETINEFLIFSGYPNVFFDGNNLVFTNNNIQEIIPYISNEYTYDISNNIVYRSNEKYNNIIKEFIVWIIQDNIESSDFGVSINKLLRYLCTLGDNIISQLDTFTDPLNNDVFDPSNNPLNFYINRVWQSNYKSNTQLQMLNNNPNETYYNNNILFPYKVKFSDNEIFTGATYSAHYVNGDKINNKDINIESPMTYPDMLTFYSQYDIMPSDFVLIKKKYMYNINSKTYLGQLYNINFTNFNLKFIDMIYWKNNSLTIKSIDTINNIVTIYIPDKQIPSNTDMFEVRNILGIVSINIVGVNQMITFYSENFNYIPNKTFLKTNSNTYLLYKDYLGGYYVSGSNIEFDSYNVTIINTIDATNIYQKNQYAYNFTIDASFDSYYDLVPNNSIIPMDFQLLDSSNNINNPIMVQTIDSSTIQLIFNNIISTSNTNTIQNTQCVGTTFTNKVNCMTKYEEYLYNINMTVPATSTSSIYVFDASNILPLIIDTSDVSIYFNQNNNVTYFSLSKLYTLDDIINKRFIQINYWDISQNNYSIRNNFISIVVPDDFILNTSNDYFYKINDIGLDKNTFIYNNGILSAQYFTSVLPTGTIKLYQYYNNNMRGMILIPNENQKVDITLDYPWQYTMNEKYYVLPITIKDTLYNTYMYKIKTIIPTTLHGFREIGFGIDQTYKSNKITLYCMGVPYYGTIFDEYHDGFYVNLIISLNQLSIDNNFDITIDNNMILPSLTNVWSYSLYDNIIMPIKLFTDYMNTFQFASYYKSTSSINTVSMFMNSTTENYNIIGNSTTALIASKFYLVSYNDFTVTNEFYPNKCVQNQNMKQNISYSYSNQTIVEEPKFNDYSKFFSYIRFYINDNMVEELNEDTFNINYYMYLSKQKRQQFDKIVQIRSNNNGWELRIPLEFWFNNKPGKTIPIIALQYSELRLEYKLNDITYILSNDMSSTNNIIPSIKLNLDTDFILLDTMERNLFGSFSHEYVIDRYRTYLPHNIYYDVSNNLSVLYKTWTGLVKDIYFIAKPLNYNGVTYFPQVISKYDNKYERYSIAVQYTKDYIMNNHIYTSTTKPYSADINIILNNKIELANYLTASNKSSYIRINNLYNLFSSWAIWDSELNLLQYLMYYEDYYLASLIYINNSYSNQHVANINYILTMYLNYIYSTKQIINMISPINTIKIKANGTDLFAKRDFNYYTNVIPSQKFNNNLPTGYYSYSFSLYPKEEQWSGHLNFTNLEDVVIEIESNFDSNGNPQPYQLSTVLKEYNILRIMSGLGGMAWID